MKPGMVPENFKPLLWSYDFSKIDAERDKKTIIINTINYGDLPHWRWLIAVYGKEGVSAVLKSLPATELRPRARRLAELIFQVIITHVSRSPQS